MGTEESDRCREVLNKSQCMDSLRTADVFPVVEATTGNASAVRRLMYGLSAKKSGLKGRFDCKPVPYFLSQGCNRLKYLDVSWNQLSHTREQLGITRKHLITLTHLDTRNNPWQKVNTLVTYPQIDHSTIPCDMSWLYTGIFCKNCSGRDP